MKLTSYPEPVFCDTCTRVLNPGDASVKWWLIGFDDEQLVVRCPQHITEWSMRKIGMKRTTMARRWKSMAKKQDKPPSNPLVEPINWEKM